MVLVSTRVVRVADDLQHDVQVDTAVADMWVAWARLL